MKFAYQARSKEGGVKQGVVVALDKPSAERLLADNGLIIISLQPEQDNIFSKLNLLGSGVKNKDLVLFSRQLATLIAARMPLLQALRILEAQLTSKRLVEITGDLISSIENGESLSLALSKHSDVFGNMYISLVKSGEVSGTLNKSLIYLADQLEKDYQLRAKVKSALTYPVFVVATLVGVGLLMFKFVLPKLTAVLIEQGGELPVVSKGLIAVTNFINVYWWFLIIATGGIIVAVRWYINTVPGRYMWDELKLKAPIFGNIFERIYMVRFSRNLGTLVAGGIPIIQALQIIAQLINNVIYRDIILEATEQLANGKSISGALANHPEFPPIVTQMVKVGEETAQLEEILDKIASFYEKEVDEKVSTLTTLLEPLIMIVLGLGVGALVAGILLPIYNLASTVG
jgi:type IV pilus assembly protein PilC